METNQAAEHLQTIRTLMERSALYRRALAPIMTLNGTLGTLAAIIGILARIDSPRSFLGYWMIVGLFAVTGSFLLARRQSLKEAEPFWSPPTRRVAQALLPPLTAGFVIGVVVLIHSTEGLAARAVLHTLVVLWLPLGWIVLYGCALHAAGFFMPRGMKVFGLAFILGGCAFFALGFPDWADRLYYSHGIMGSFFGLLHLAYGVYLYFTEKRRNES